MMRVDVWHNVLWSRYKGRVFSELHRLARSTGDEYRFFQMGETEGGRVALGSVDLAYHQYPFELLYRGSIEELSKFRTVPRYFLRALRNRADFVLIAGYSEPQNWAQLFGLMLRGTPRGVFCDSTLADRPPSRLKSFLKSFFFKRCDVIFCYGQRARELVLKHGAREENVVVRCQAAAMLETYDAAAVPAARVARKQEARFLYVGRLAPEKNLHRLIEAFARYRAERPDATLRLVGGGPLRDELVALAERLGVGGAVTFTGGLPPEQIADEYLAASAFVLPSLSEPWGLVVNEALAYGCPVLVSDACGCVPELVDPGDAGLSFDPHSVEALVEGLSRMELEFGDTLPVAEACLARIAGFSPQAAASQILTAIHRSQRRAET